ncbi:LTA synthase family protein [Mesobacillus harenae]|uniref:LTA synthase family protein n=1 Tax=Mesobacillus harenae TaxID=2213203 RepID=UPI001580BE8A|nr:alkaline phosphatase family protein [Mesobacillus harenae]
MASIFIYSFFFLITNRFYVALLAQTFQDSTKQTAVIILLLFFIISLFYKVESRVYDDLRRSRFTQGTLFKFILVLFVGVLAAMTGAFLLEFSYKLGNAFNSTVWITQHKGIFIYNSVMLFFIILLFYSIFGNIFGSAMVFLSFAGLFSFTNYQKRNLLGDPLFPSDFLQVTHIQNVIPMIEGFVSVPLLIAALAGVVFLFLLIRFLPKLNIRLRYRFLLLLLSLVMTYSLIYHPKTYMKSFAEMANIQITPWNQLTNYINNGFLAAFISNLYIDVFEEPEGYSKNYVLKVASEIKEANAKNVLPKYNKEINSPNVIFLMNESFWDPTRLNAEFSEDPLKTVRSHMNEGMGGDLLSPMFGGGTANVEFEALTGYSMSFLQPGAIPYQQLVDMQPGIMSFVGSLKDKGYSTLAIHPYEKYVYKRNRVYSSLGFDRFLGVEDMDYQQRSGPFVSDEALTDQIINELKGNNESMFIHAVSMQNHFPYDKGRYPKNEVSVDGLSESSNDMLEVFTEGIRQADDAVKRLTEEIEKLNEPTILVFWGDHLPILGSDKALYKEADFAGITKTNEETREYFETPYFVFANFNIPKLENEAPISPIYLGPIVFEITGLKSAPFYNFLTRLRQEIPGLKRDLYIDSSNNEIENFTDEQKVLLEQYKLIQYDLLVGEQYSKSILFDLE